MSAPLSLSPPLPSSPFPSPPLLLAPLKPQSAFADKLDAHEAAFKVITAKMTAAVDEDKKEIAASRRALKGKLQAELEKFETQADKARKRSRKRGEMDGVGRAFG